MSAAAEEAVTYQQTEELLKEVSAVFSEKEDIQTVRDSGRAIADLHAITEQRHREMMESIKGACCWQA